jgi:hypothetical protein
MQEAAVIGAFIFREARELATGIGLGTDMMFLSNVGRRWKRVPSDKVRDGIEAIVPSVGDAIGKLWSEKIKEIPEWVASDNFYK